MNRAWQDAATPKETPPNVIYQVASYDAREAGGERWGRAAFCYDSFSSGPEVGMHMTLPVRSLPVLQNWDCRSCGDCCRELEIVVTEEEKKRIEALDLANDPEIGPG